MGSCAAMSHQAKVETGKGLPPPKGNAAWQSQQAAGSWASTSPAEQQALVQHWLQTEVQGCSGEPGDKPSIAGAHRLYEQHTRSSGSTDKPMGNGTFSGIARELLSQLQHQELASRFPLFKPRHQ
jgi:hypothetical protein